MSSSQPSQQMVEMKKEHSQGGRTASVELGKDMWDSPRAVGPLHNVNIAQYLLLATIRVATYYKICVLFFHLSYIYHSSFGFKQNIDAKELQATKFNFVIFSQISPCIKNRILAFYVSIPV